MPDSGGNKAQDFRKIACVFVLGIHRTIEPILLTAWSLRKLWENLKQIIEAELIHI